MENLQTEYWLSRQDSLIGENKTALLEKSRVFVFGAGGVGGYIIESLARSGIGALAVCDGDIFSISNLNRQILATRSTLGQPKAQIAKDRINLINPGAQAIAYNIFADASNINKILEEFKPDFIADAIDTITSKLEIIQAAKNRDIKIISCMGTGNKLDPAKFKIADINQTSVCPLAKVMRHELKSLGITGVPVLFSEEPPIARRPPASISYAPAAAGLLIASYILRELGEF